MKKYEVTFYDGSKVIVEARNKIEAIKQARNLRTAGQTTFVSNVILVVKFVSAARYQNRPL